LLFLSHVTFHNNVVGTRCGFHFHLRLKSTLWMSHKDDCTAPPLHHTLLAQPYHKDVRKDGNLTILVCCQP
jgi:GMP synthase-like glutamine amidotransferase